MRPLSFGVIMSKIKIGDFVRCSGFSSAGETYDMNGVIATVVSLKKVHDVVHARLKIEGVKERVS